MLALCPTKTFVTDHQAAEPLRAVERLLPLSSNTEAVAIRLGVSLGQVTKARYGRQRGRMGEKYCESLSTEAETARPWVALDLLVVCLAKHQRQGELRAASKTAQSAILEIWCGAAQMAVSTS